MEISLWAALSNLAQKSEWFVQRRSRLFRISSSVRGNQPVTSGITELIFISAEIICVSIKWGFKIHP
jgi:hypothetical protein